MEESITNSLKEKEEVLKKMIISEALGNKKQQYIDSIEKNPLLQEEQKRRLKRALDGNIDQSDMEKFKESAESMKRQATRQIEKISEEYKIPTYVWCNNNSSTLATVFKYVSTLAFCPTTTLLVNGIAAHEGSKIDWENLLFAVDMLLLMSTVVTLGQTLPLLLSRATLTTGVKFGMKKLFVSAGKQILMKPAVIKTAVKESAKKLGTLAHKGFQKALLNGKTMTQTVRVLGNQVATKGKLIIQSTEKAIASQLGSMATISNKTVVAGLAGITGVAIVGNTATAGNSGRGVILNAQTEIKPVYSI